MNISMISEHASPLAALGGVDAGGQNVHVAALSRALADLGHDVTVFTRRDDEDLPDIVDSDVRITVVHVRAGPAAPVPKDELLPFMPEMGRGIAEFWRTHPDTVPDIVHSHFWMSGIAGRTALDEAGLEDTPLVHTFHALGTVKRRHQGAADTSPVERRWMEPAVGHFATRIIATCSDEVSELEAMGIDPSSTSIIPCGVDLAEFTPDGDRDTSGPRRILSVGRLVPRKGMDLVIRALPLLADLGFGDVELHVIGGGQQADLDDDPEARRLRTLAGELGVADRVVLHGQVPRSTMPAHFRGADLVACTPWYEPFGIVPLEAMACGTPVLAARTGGLADSVVDDVTGVHVPPRDPAAIAHAAARVLGAPAQAEAMGEQGVLRARECYSWSVIARATEEVYEELLSADRHHVDTSTMADVGILTDDLIRSHLDGVGDAVASLHCQSMVLGRWGRELATCLPAGGQLFTAGNGGSAAEAQHLSSELVGRFRKDRPAFSALALSTDSSAVTAISNDYGYDQVFARQLHAHARAGDVLVLLSTSGNSPNLLRAAETANELGLRVWGLTGPLPNPLAELCDEVVAIDADSPNVQEAHLMAIHAVCCAFEAELERHDRGLRTVGRLSSATPSPYQEAQP